MQQSNFPNQAKVPSFLRDFSSVPVKRQEIIQK